SIAFRTRVCFKKSDLYVLLFERNPTSIETLYEAKRSAEQGVALSPTDPKGIAKLNQIVDKMRKAKSGVFEPEKPSTLAPVNHPPPNEIKVNQDIVTIDSIEEEVKEETPMDYATLGKTYALSNDYYSAIRFYSREISLHPS